MKRRRRAGIVRLPIWTTTTPRNGWIRTAIHPDKSLFCPVAGRIFAETIKDGAGAGFMNYDVFISYTTQDKPTADAICHTLEAQGVRCWIAPRDIQLGDNYAETIIKAINAAKLMVLVFSGSTNNSRHVGNEVERAFNRGVPMIPFRIEDTVATGALEYVLRMPHWLDAFSPPLQQHLNSLGEFVLGLLAAREGQPPAAPAQQSAVTAPISPPPQSPRRLLRVPLALAGATVVLAAVGFGAFYLRAPKPDVKISVVPEPVVRQIQSASAARERTASTSAIRTCCVASASASLDAEPGPRGAGGNGHAVR